QKCAASWPHPNACCWVGALPHGSSCRCCWNPPTCWSFGGCTYTTSATNVVDLRVSPVCLSCHSSAFTRPLTVTRDPLRTSSAAFSASGPHTCTRCQSVGPASTHCPDSSFLRGVSATEKLHAAIPDAVNLISPSDPARPLMLMLLLTAVPFD